MFISLNSLSNYTLQFNPTISYTLLSCPTSILLKLCSCFFALGSSFCVGPTKKSKSSPGVYTDQQQDTQLDVPYQLQPAYIATLSPESRSFQQCATLGKESPVLFATAVILQETGSVNELAQRLFNRYQQQQPTGGAIPRPSSVATISTSQVNEPLTSTIMPFHPTESNSSFEKA